MKEKDARLLYCPMSNVQDDRQCIASECMMWRWEAIYGNLPFSGRVIENGLSKTDGYCGIGGKP
jgi:hypothetical protein